MKLDLSSILMFVLSAYLGLAQECIVNVTGVASQGECWDYQYSVYDDCTTYCGGYIWDKLGCSVLLDSPPMLNGTFPICVCDLCLNRGRNQSAGPCNSVPCTNPLPWETTPPTNNSCTDACSDIPYSNRADCIGLGAGPGVCVCY
jgi:hypothetical protein